jgi:methylated-DNA-[protein]-cysteine S-methyltransferase
MTMQKAEPLHYAYVVSPVGPLLVAGSDAGLSLINFQTGRHVRQPEAAWVEDRAPFEEAIAQLSSYFDGTLQRFELKLAPRGTPFQLAVWQKLLEVAYGETISYGELARRVGNPRASRAVGAANGQNPLPIVVPCHRVIGQQGKLTGYGGGLPIKELLLDLERRHRAALLF